MNARMNTKRLFSMLMALIMCLAILPVTSFAATKPAPPKNLKAVSVGPNSVKLSWKKVSGAKQYIIYQKAWNETKYKKVATTKNTSYTVKKLYANAKYSFKVAVKTSKGTSNKSKAVTVKTKDPPGGGVG